MKKLLLIAALTFASFGVFADEIADEFDSFVTVIKQNSAQQGWEVRSDKKKRTVFFYVKLPSASEGVTQEVFDAAKPELVRNFKKSTGATGIDFLKTRGITLVFVFTTTDSKQFKVTISPRDLEENDSKEMP